MARHYAILGGGVLGLTAALRLLQRGQRVTLYEREPLPGGLAAGFRVDLPQDAQQEVQPDAPEGERATDEGIWLDKFYHHLFRSDRAITRLIGEVGLADALEWLRPKTTTLIGGRRYQLDSPLSVLRFPPLTLPQRLWLAAGLAVFRLLPTARPLEGRTAAPWVRALMGPAAYRAVWEPLFRGKFGAVADQIALPWFWARIHDRSPELGYVRGGFQRFYDALADRVRALGGEVCFATEVRTVEPFEDGYIVTSAPVAQPDHVSRSRVDRVISTLPTRLTARLIPALPAAWRAQYEWGQAYGAHVLILALDRPLTDDSYWMNINDPGYPFMVLVEHTNYLPPEDYGGRRLVYLGNYRAMDDPLFGQSRAEVLAAFLPHLKRINPAFDPAWVRESWLFRAPFAQPIVTTDFKRHIPPLETPLPGLYLANMFQVYPHDRGQNYSVALAEELIDRIEPARDEIPPP